MNKRILHPLSYAAFAMMLALPPVMASAQSDDTADSFEIIGLIEAATLNTVTINGQTYDITQAQLDIPLNLGAAVKLEASAVNGLIIVREVQALDDDTLQPGEIKIEGIVEVLTVNGIQVAGQLIDLSTAAVEPGVVVGERAELTLVMNENGQLVLTHVEPADEDEQGEDEDNDDGADDQNEDQGEDSEDQGEDEADDGEDTEDVKLVGTLDQIGADFIVLSGVTISTPGLPLENLVLGTVVKVEAVFVNNGFVADELDYEDTDVDDQGDDNEDQDENEDDDVIIDIGNSCAINVPAGWTTYVVTSGDSLSGLAARTGSSVEDLAQVNCIANPSNLSAGVTLAVPRTPDPRPVNVEDDDDDQGDDDGTDDQGGDNDDDQGDDDNGGDDDGTDDQGGDNDDDQGNDDNGEDDGDDDNSGHGSDDDGDDD